MIAGLDFCQEPSLWFLCSLAHPFQPVPQTQPVFFKDSRIVKVKVMLLSRVQFSVTPWSAAFQAPLSMEFSRQEYWGGLPFPTPGDLPNLGIKLVSLASSALASGFFTNEPPGRPPKAHRVVKLTD